MQPAKTCRPVPEPCRRDGWTADRQLGFLENLARTRSVSAAAAAVGMSRESAYRLRRRDPAGLFAAAWDRAMGAGRVTLTRAEVDEGHRRLIAGACGPEAAAKRPNPPHNQFRDLSPYLPPARELPRISSIHNP
jgi:hypothetical protein